MAASWTTANTGIPPWDDALRKATATGYCHHIERLMVLGNAFFLCEIKPGEVHRWFMEHFVDAAEWVMGPNVYGMSQQSDGGLMATKPYVCGSAYLRRQGRLGTGPWCDVVDGLYWRFIAQHRDRLARNARMQQAVAGYDRLATTRRNRILSAAEAFLLQHTVTKK
jgi:deoxyribodipyrimidine photolyase-related protein